MTDTDTPLTDQRLDEYEALIVRTTPSGAAVASPGMAAVLLAEVRRLRESTAIEQVEQAFVAELNDDHALTLLDALTVLRSKLPCACARSQGLHEKHCRRYAPGHELLGTARRLARARRELTRKPAPAASSAPVSPVPVPDAPTTPDAAPRASMPPQSAADAGTVPESHRTPHGPPESRTAVDTLPAWLYQRFAVIHGAPAWDRLDDAQRPYWEHQARAVRRAVDRGGFKPAVPAVAETGE